MSFCACVCFLYRMQCADILADRDTDGQWTIAKAVFSGTVTGTVTLVRTTTAKVFFTNANLSLVVKKDYQFK